jgi:two-component system, NtrC family, sensor kinase
VWQTHFEDREVRLLFTRTIRRKLLVGAGLVLGMLLILAVTGLWALVRSRAVMHDLAFDLTEAPQTSGLVFASAELKDAIFSWPTKNEANSAFWQSHVWQLIDETKLKSAEFRRRADHLPPKPFWIAQRPFTNKLLANFEEMLGEIERLTAAMREPEGRTATYKNLRSVARRLKKISTEIPDPVEGRTEDKLAQVRQVYDSAMITLGITSAVIAVIFLVWLRSGYVWIFVPIRKLHQGARRVAQGDFRYRVELKTHDEMGELAEAFNKMTARFQEITTDLDHQVQQRSQQLVRSERLAGVGFLAAGVAHEINNPLSAIAMASESLEGRILPQIDTFPAEDRPVVPQYLKMIQDEAFRCREITGRLLDFARAGNGAREPTDVSRLVEEVVAMVQHLSKYRDKQIEFDCPGACTAEVHASEIKQVILNLVANGLEAVEPGGKLRISIREQTDELAITFVDNGCGMTPEIINNLFEPFFTSKVGGQGTGLGLSISNRIVNQHGGTISPSSEGPGRGSTFVVRLPRRASAARAA